MVTRKAVSVQPGAIYTWRVTGRAVVPGSSEIKFHVRFGPPSKEEVVKAISNPTQPLECDPPLCQRCGERACVAVWLAVSQLEIGCFRRRSNGRMYYCWDHAPDEALTQA